MSWYNPLSWNKSAPTEEVEEKLNPAQVDIGRNKTESSREPTFNYQQAYERIEIVNRGVNMIVDDLAEIPYNVGGNITGSTAVSKGVKAKTIYKLLNHEPNPFQDISSFRRNLFIDLLLDGNIFIYFDGAHLYHLPSEHMSIEASTSTYIKNFKYKQSITYKPSEIIHIKENSFYSIYRGVPRLKPALRSMQVLERMRAFQDNFFKNDAVPGLVIETPDTLSSKIKDRLAASWSQKYNPKTGGKSPMILDGGAKIANLSKFTFSELDFDTSIATHENTILKALGIPPVLLNSGNNANIRPNLRLYYLETIIPVIKKFNSAFERQFGFDITEDVTNISSLQPELKEQAAYFSTLVNGGILSPNEARLNLGLKEIEGHDDLRIPANIAGSAANPAEGGKPAEDDE